MHNEGSEVEVSRVADRGASLIEYALLVALIALVCFVAVVVLGEVTSEDLSRTADSVQAA